MLVANACVKHGNGQAKSSNQCPFIINALTLFD